MLDMWHGLKQSIIDNAFGYQFHYYYYYKCQDSSDAITTVAQTLYKVYQ